MAAMQESMQSAKDMVVESMRESRDSIVRPALAQKLTTQEQLADFAEARDPLQFASTLNFVRARYKVPAGQVPVRIVRYVQRMEKLREKQEAKDAT